jgi:hypothetical protein
MKRHQTLLLGLLVLQLAVIVLVRSPWSDASAGTAAHPLLPDLDAASVTRVELDGSEGKSLTLEKQDGSWVVSDVGDYPADDQKVDDLIDKLAGLEVRRPVVTGRRYHKAFEIGDDDNRGRVRVYGGSTDRPEADLILGNSPNYRVQNVRRADENDVFEVRGLASYDVSPEPGSWAEKELVEVSEGDLVGLRLVNAAGTIELERDATGWHASAPQSLVGATLDDGSVDALLRSARSVRIDTPVGPVDEAAQGLTDPAATVTLRWRPGGVSGDEESGEDASGDDGPGGDTAGEDASGGGTAAAPPVEELTFRIGGKLPDKESQRYVTRDGFGFTGTVWESSISKLIAQDPTGLLPGEPEGQ